MKECSRLSSKYAKAYGWATTSFRCVGLFIFFRLQTEGQNWMWLAQLPLSGLLTGCLMCKAVHKESYHEVTAHYYSRFNAGTTEGDDPHELTQKWHSLAWSAIPLLLRINPFHPDVTPSQEGQFIQVLWTDERAFKARMVSRSLSFYLHWKYSFFPSMIKIHWMKKIK